MRRVSKRIWVRKSKVVIGCCFILSWLSALIITCVHLDWSKWPLVQRSIAAFIHPGEDSHSARLKPKSAQFGLVIPKLKINAPVIDQVDGRNPTDYDAKLQSGVAHEKRTPLPDVSGNTVIFGHSSKALGYKQTEYSEVFAALGDLENGDQIIVWYNGIKYNYFVVEIKVVPATAVEILNNTTEKRLTLYTCWPPSTNENRLVIIAKIYH